MPELKARCFVGLDGKFVMVSKFPDTEDYAGLHELLTEWAREDDTLTCTQGDLFQMGHYELFFEVNQVELFNPERDMTDVYLELESYKKVL